MTDLVVVSLENWDGVWRRNQYLVDGLLRIDPELRVLFVEPAADPLHDARSGRRPRFGHTVAAIGDTGRLCTWRPTKWLPRRVDPGFDRRFARQVRDAATRLGFADPVLWINDPRAADVMTETGWPTLYDITDDWAVADRPDAERARIVQGEERLLIHAAEVVACSAELVRRKSPQRPAKKHPIVLIPNAVDVAEYQRPRPRPAVLPTGRVALYAGTLHEDRLDVNLVAETAARLTGEATVVLAGPNALSKAATARLKSAGVCLTGALQRDTLIGCLQHADVLIVPHLVNAFTDSLDPIKLYEYLAVGRPVVSTPVAGFRDTVSPAITLVAGENLADRLRGASQRTVDRPVGPSVDWSDRVVGINEVLSDVLATR